MARIYVSSTFSDLKEYREQVRLALRRMDHEDVAMEYYSASDERPLDKCLKDVEASDVYIGIFAWRYGFIPEGYDTSITELEFRKAVASGKECLLFLLDEDAPWPMSLIEITALERIKALRSECRTNHLVAFFTDKPSLEARVSQAVSAWEKRQGLKRTWTNWEQYRQALFEEYRWVRLSVIAGAKQDRITRIPLTEVFVPQLAQRGRPRYEVPDEALRLKRELYSQEHSVDEQASAESDATLQGELELDGENEDENSADAGEAFPELITDVLGREHMQVLLGGPGSGKSTLLYSTILTLCVDDPPPGLSFPSLQQRPLPLLIELRQFVLKKSPDFLSYLVTHIAERYGVSIDQHNLVALLKDDKRAVLIFDGLDEIFDPTERAVAIQKFQILARQYPQTLIIVSSRIVGYDPLELGVSGFEHYTLLDFTTLQMRQFVPKWYQYYTWEGDAREAHGLIQRILDNPRLQDLAGNPLLLTMMAIIYKHQDLPEQRWKLYEHCTEVLLEDWDIKRKSIDRKTLPLDINIRAAQKAEILQRVALYMLENGQANRELNAIAYQPLLRILASYLEERYHKAPGEAQAIAQEILSHLRERTYILAEIGEGIFGFVHRTFMEYFAAVSRKEEFNGREADYEWLTETVFGAYWQRYEWQEPLFLLSAMLAAQRSPFQKVVAYLRRRGGYPHNIAFAARCLAETGWIEDVGQAQHLIIDLARLLATYVHRPNEYGATRIVDECMAAFVILAPLVPMPSAALEVIRDLEQAKSVRERMTAWQMELALRSRQERREFALTALTDKQEVVRRGAIAALEREWAGNEAVGRALIEVVRVNRHTRVRQAALEALERGWPGEEAVLTAIESRLRDETAYTYGLWLIKYLATNWRGHPQARELMLILSEWDEPIPLAGYNTLAQTAITALAQGWRDDPETLPLLHLWAVSERPSSFRLAAIRAIVEGWRNDPTTLPLLQRCALHNQDQRISKAALSIIGRAWPRDTDTLPLLHDRATRSPKADVREIALRVIVQGWRSDWKASQQISFPSPDAETTIATFFGRDDLSTLQLLRNRAIKDWSTDMRSFALEALGTGWQHNPATHALLCERAAQDTRPGVRWTALWMVVKVWRDDSATLTLLHDRLQHDADSTIRGLIVMMIVGLPLWYPLRRVRSLNQLYRRIAVEHRQSYSEGFSKWQTISFWGGKTLSSSRETLSLLEDRARNDPAAIVRALALRAVIMVCREQREIIALLRERHAAEADTQVHALIERLLVEPSLLEPDRFKAEGRS